MILLEYANQIVLETVKDKLSMCVFSFFYLALVSPFVSFLSANMTLLSCLFPPTPFARVQHRDW